MVYLIMTYGRDFEPMAENFCDSYMIFKFYAMSTCWPNVHCGDGGDQTMDGGCPCPSSGWLVTIPGRVSGPLGMVSDHHWDTRQFSQAWWVNVLGMVGDHLGEGG